MCIMAYLVCKYLGVVMDIEFINYQVIFSLKILKIKIDNLKDFNVRVN